MDPTYREAYYIQVMNILTEENTVLFTEVIFL